MTGTVRWVFVDDAETWTVPINPDSMTSPLPPQKALSTGPGRIADVGGDYRVISFLGKPTLWDWEFSGVIRTKDHYDQLLYWASKTVSIEVTDHLARTWRVYLTNFQPTDRQPTPRVSWRLRYTMKAKILAKVES